MSNKADSIVLRLEQFCKNYLYSTTNFHAYWSRQITEKVDQRSIDCGIMKIDFYISQNEIDSYIEKMEKLKYLLHNKSSLETEKNSIEEKTSNESNSNGFNLQTFDIEKRYGFIILYLLFKSYFIIPLSTDKNENNDNNEEMKKQTFQHNIFNEEQTDAATMNEIVKKYHFIYCGHFKEEFNLLMKKFQQLNKIEYKDSFGNELKNGSLEIFKEWKEVYGYLYSFFKTTYNRNRKYIDDNELVKILTQIEKWHSQTFEISKLNIQYWYIFIGEYNSKFYCHLFSMLSSQYIIALRLLLEQP